MDSVKEKLGRANIHLNTLRRVMKRFRDREPYGVGFKTVSEGNRRLRVCYVDKWRPMPTSIPLIVGDVCNNLWSALDHLWWQLWLDIDPTFDERVTFPIFPNETSFDNARPFHVKRLLLPTMHHAAVKGVQPYNRGNDLLTILQELDNIDKHRLLSAVTATALTEEITISQAFQPTQPYAFPIAQVRPNLRIEKGAELFRFPLDQLSNESKSEVNAQFQFEFLFAQPSMVANRGVVTTMRRIRDEVRWVLS